MAAISQKLSISCRQAGMHGTLYLVVGTPSERPSKCNPGQSGKFDEDYLTKPDYTVKETRSFEVWRDCLDDAV